MIHHLGRLARRLRLLMRRDAAERWMDAELRHHLESDIAERVASGSTPEAARRAALAAFGNVESVKELARDARGTRPFEDLGYDVRFGVRHLMRNPGFTVPALLTLALAVGAATAIYSLVYGILLRPLPYADPDQLVVLWERNVPRNRDQNVVSLDTFEGWRERSQSFVSMSALIPTSVTLDGEPVAERLVGADVTPGYFTLLGVQPVLGRDFTSGDGDAAVILSDALWKRRFAADPGVVGRGVTLSGRSFTVVGVMPPDFEPPRIGWLGHQELWFPFVATPQSRAWGRAFIVVARLRDDVDAQQGRAEVVALAAQRDRESPGNAEWSASLIPLHDQITGDAATSLLVLFAAVVLLLSMAVANVTTLSLSMLGRRQQELSLRRAIGATERRLLRQLFVQSALLGAAGVAIGASLAFPLVEGLLALLPPDVPRVGSVAVDGPVLLAAAVAGMMVTLIFGIVAAVRGRQEAESSPLSAISAGSRRTSRAAGGTLVVAEIALAVTLSVMAVLMLRTFASLQDVDLGFDSQNVLLVRVALPGVKYDTPERQRAFFERATERVRLIEGVERAGIISSRPLGGVGPATTVRDAASAPGRAGEDPVADVRLADAELFSALRMRLETGSSFDRLDTTSDPGRAVISASLARQLWPGRDPVGRFLAVGMYGGIQPMVAGVVNDIHLMDARTPPRPTVYLPAARFTGTVRDVVIRAQRDPERLVPAIRAAVAAVDQSVALYMVTTMSRLVDAELATDRLTMFLLVSFAAAALVLAAIGVVGVFASDVTRRRREIGVRLALGAAEGGIVRLLLTASLRRAVVGVGAGWMLAVLLGRGMKGMLFGVTVLDPVSFGTAGAAAIGLASLATLLPVWEALRSSPLDALREQ